MGIEKIRRRAVVAKRVSIKGSSVEMSSDAIVTNASTAVIGTAALVGKTGAIVVRANTAGTPCIAFRHADGTVYAMYFNPAGGAVTGTPVTA